MIMKQIEYNQQGKPRGLYDPSTTEVFMTKLGQEIFKVTDSKTHKTQMTDEDWILYCDTAGKCVRFGTLWGPKEMSDFKESEIEVIKLFLNKRRNNV
tara:strand:+ start:483 stop:773 length:291 start_codon:yes stop_codon:yes gene_type:complete